MKRLFRKIKVIILILLIIDLTELLLSKYTLPLYGRNLGFAGNFWFAMDTMVNLLEISAVLPLLRIKEWARKLWIGSSCYSILSLSLALFYTIMDSFDLSTGAAFSQISAHFISFLAMAAVPTLLIYFLQSKEVIKIFRPGVPGTRDFLVFDEPLPQFEFKVRVKRILAALIDLIIYSFLLGTIAGLIFLNFDISSRERILVWLSILGTPLIWRDSIFSPGRYFLRLRLVNVKDGSPVTLLNQKCFVNLAKIILRNFLLLIPFVLVFGYVFELTIVLLVGNRFGDGLAGTIVIKHTRK